MKTGNVIKQLQLKVEKLENDHYKMVVTIKHQKQLISNLHDEIVNIYEILKT